MIDKRFYQLYHRTDESVVKNKYILHTSVLHTYKHIYEQYKVKFDNNNPIIGITTPRISLAGVYNLNRILIQIYWSVNMFAYQLQLNCVHGVLDN